MHDAYLVHLGFTDNLPSFSVGSAISVSQCLAILSGSNTTIWSAHDIDAFCGDINRIRGYDNLDITLDSHKFPEISTLMSR